MDNHTPEQRRKNMQAVKNRDSKIELTLRKALWAKGIRYRKNVKNIYGHPDIAMIGKKIVIFCDSEFWHGYDWSSRKNDIKSNRDFWIKKIERNIERDAEVNKALSESGWSVIRFWGKDIIKSTDACVKDIEAVIQGCNNLQIGTLYRKNSEE